jgi:hypothetical protein
MPQIARTTPPIESMLLRKSVGALAARRHRCFHCGRTPLVGEHVYLYETAAGERMVCELCRPLRREAPARSEVVHSVEHDRAVRRRAPRAA